MGLHKYASVADQLYKMKIHEVTTREIPSLLRGAVQGCQQRTYLRLILVIPAPFYCCHCGFTTQTSLAAIPSLCQHAAIHKALPTSATLSEHFFFTTLSQCNPAPLAVSHSAYHTSQSGVRAERCIPAVQHAAQGHALRSCQFLFSLLIFSWPCNV